jgi:hypothetical protein
VVAHREFRAPLAGIGPIELMRLKWSVRSDVRMFIGTVARMINRENFHVAHSQNIFYRAKILRKLRYAANW